MKIHKEEIVRNKIKHLLGVSEDKPRIAGRKTVIKKVGKGLASDFLNKFHIQGDDKHTTALGAFYGDILIGVMTFKVLAKGGLDYDLTRFATDYNYICQGIGSKLLSHFIREYKPTSIISFADRRWTLDKDNNLYTKLGFELVSESRPDYRYYNTNVDRYIRFHKFGFRKQILSKKYNLPMEMTETDMVKQLGYDKIWDCGLLKYRLDVK